MFVQKEVEAGACLNDFHLVERKLHSPSVNEDSSEYKDGDNMSLSRKPLKFYYVDLKNGIKCCKEDFHLSSGCHEETGALNNALVYSYRNIPMRNAVHKTSKHRCIDDELKKKNK